MIFQHAALDIRAIPEKHFPDISDYIRKYLQALPAGMGSLCEQLNYSPSYIARWAGFTRYNADTGTIVNDCTVYAHPLVFTPMLRALIRELATAFPQASFHGSLRLFNSHWGYDIHSFKADQQHLVWEPEILARQQPQMQKFWEAMKKSCYADIPDLLTAMYAPMAVHQLSDAFQILEDLFFDPAQEVTPVDACCFDNAGIPERESMVEFTHNCFLGYCWERYADIWDFFRAVKEAFSQKNIPFDFPDGFYPAETDPDS